MASFTVDEVGIVSGVMSFDPVDDSQTYVHVYDTELIGKRFENGVFVDVETNEGGGS